MKDKISKMSIRSRLAYGACCLEQAYIKNNINNSITNQILEKLWRFTSEEKLNLWEDLIVEILPSSILEDHPENDFSDYETLQEFEVKEFYEFYKESPNYLNEMVDLIAEIGLCDLYGKILNNGECSLNAINKIVIIMLENKIELPNIENFLVYSFNIENGWGKTFKKNEINI